MLLAQEKYRRGGRWHTHIDYDAFQRLVSAWYATGAAFGSEDFCAPTPEWAVWGAEAAGFSPAEERGRRGGRALKAGAAGAGEGGAGEEAYVPSESGCG